MANDNDTKCLPKCSGLQVLSYVQENIEKNTEMYQEMDTFHKMQLEILDDLYSKVFGHALPTSLTTWSMFCI